MGSDAPLFKAMRSTKATSPSFEAWLDDEINKTPERRAAVEALVAEMEVEQQPVALREAQGLTQQQVAERAGVSQALVGRLESGRGRNIGLHTLVKTVMAMGGRVRVTIEVDKPTRAVALSKARTRARKVLKSKKK